MFVVILMGSGWIRYLQTKDYKTAFTFDQARDLLDIRALGEFKDLAVLGPTTSINGLRLGPFYYYFNLPAYWIGGGDPQMLVFWNILGFLFTAIAIYWFFYKKNIWLGFWFGTFFLTAPQLFNTTRYYWNANMATYLSVFYFLALINYWTKTDKKSILFLGATAGLLTQFEAAFGIVCLIYAGVLVLTKRKIKDILWLIVGVVPWFLPQVALEIKNRFQMTKLLIGMVTGENMVLGDKLGLIETIVSHYKSIILFFEGQFILPYGVGIILLLLAIFLALTNKDCRKITLGLVGFLFFAFVFYTLIYRHELKGWYIESLRVWYCLLVALGAVSLERWKKFTLPILFVFLIRNLYLTTIDQWQFTHNKPTDDPKHLANLINNVDWVYQKMNGQGFRAYNYVPEVYDYPNQYLYWWYGREKYGYMPGVVSYSITEVPEYLRTQKDFYDQAKDSEKNIAIIYENKSDYQSWLNQFKEYCVKDRWLTNWRTTVEIREKCVF